MAVTLMSLIMLSLGLSLNQLSDDCHQVY